MSLELDYLFHPRSIAVVGASTDPQQQGHSFLKLHLNNGFKGKVYAVNPKAKEILGVTSYSSLLDIPEEVDYVISCIPSGVVPQLIDEASRKGVKVVHLYTARFSETGRQEDAQLEQEVLRRARASGIRVIGPNCMGIYYAREGLVFMDGFPKESGPVAMLSQSGGNAVELISAASTRGVRFSKVISYGNAVDLNEADFLDYLADDPETRVICASIEGTKDGRRLFQVLKRCTGQKPVVIMKAGRTGAGAKAVASHTASLAGSQQVWEAMCRQAGAVLVSSLEEQADALVTLHFLKPTVGVRVGIVGGSGGRSVASADQCEEAGLKVIPLPEDLRKKLRDESPLLGDWVSNPTDTSILGGSSLTVCKVLAMMAEHPDFDILIAHAGESFGLGRPGGVQRVLQTLDSYLAIGRSTAKPMAIILGDSLVENERQRETIVEMRRRCIEAGVATFPTVSRAARALRMFGDYFRHRAEADSFK